MANVANYDKPWGVAEAGATGSVRSTS